MQFSVYALEAISDDLIESITVSSALKENSKVYKAEFLIDDTDESWVEGVDGPGIGETIHIKFKKTIEIDRICIKNGFGDFLHYYENNRVMLLSITIPNQGGTEAYIEDRPGLQDITFKGVFETNRLEIRILDVYKGTKYDDTCISEISFNRWEELNHFELNRSILINLHKLEQDDIGLLIKKYDKAIIKTDDKFPYILYLETVEDIHYAKDISIRRHPESVIFFV